MPFSIIDAQSDSRVIMVTFLYQVHGRYEDLRISSGDSLNNGIHGVDINYAAQVNALSSTVRGQQGLASLGGPLGGNSRVQLNARFIRKKNRFIRLLILEFFLKPRQMPPVFQGLLCYIFYVPSEGRNRCYESNY